MKNVKIIAHYLPQFHRTKENDKFWGDGYTDWVAVKNATPVTDNQIQPKVPLNSHYYSLDDVNEIKWQAEIAKEYGVYGWGIYHYWFDSDTCLLDTPPKLILGHPEIDIHYMFNWDNSSWKRTWSAVHYAGDWAPAFDNMGQTERADGILAELVYGGKEEWKKHFMYLLPFFKDERYIKIDGKPLFTIYQPNNDYDLICEMCKYWDDLAKENGFPGMALMSKKNWLNQDLEYKMYYLPFSPTGKIEKTISVLRNKILRKKEITQKKSYDSEWKKMISRAKGCKDDKTFYGGIVQFDDTARRGKRARILTGSSPAKFENYLKQLMDICKNQNKEYLFLTAWNEWGEGAYLEPDEESKFDYLNAIKNCVN